MGLHPATICRIHRGVAPVGHPERLRTIVDIALSRYYEVWAAGGHPRYVFPTIH